MKVLDEPTRDGLTQLNLWSNLPPEVTAQQIADLYRRRWRIEGLFGRLESVLHSEIRTLGHPRAALLGFATAVLAYNVLSLLKRCIEQAHREQAPELEVSTYHLAVDVVSDYKGMLIALPPSAWSSWSEASPEHMADYLLHLARFVSPRSVATSKRGPKKPKPKGCIVTIDAIGCQKDIAAQIVAAGGDYVLAVKDNQGGLSEAVQDFFDEEQRSGFGDTPLDCVETVEKDHGWLETRRYTWIPRLDWMERPLRSQWKKLAGVGLVERRREIAGKVSVERSFYIGSQGVDSAQTQAKAARGHWGVENQLHWVLDVVFREDDCRVRRGHAARNFSALRKFALSLLRQDTQYPKRSLNSRRQTADRNASYRASLLGLQPRE